MHNILNRFRDGKGTGTDIMELNLAQENASLDQYPLLLVFLDLRKSYGTVDRDRLIITLEGYGAGPKMCGLLKTFWECQQVVPRQNGFHGPELPATRGTTKGELVSLTLFNVVVDNVIISWMETTVEHQRVDHDGLGETNERCLRVFYVNNGMVSSRESDCIHQAMNVLVGLLIRHGLAANVIKSCKMTCQPRALRGGMSEEAIVLTQMGVGDSY